MLQGFQGSHRQVTMGTGNGRGHLDDPQQATVWSRSLRGTHDNTVKKLRKEMEAKRRDRLLRKNSEPEPEAATPSCSPHDRETTAPPSPRRRPKSAEVQGAKKLLRMLHLDQLLSDVEAPEDVEPEKKSLKLKGSRRLLSSKKLRPNVTASSPAMKRDVSPLTSWRMDSKLPPNSRHVTMSSQKTAKEPAPETSEEDEEEEAPVTQWRYKPLPGEHETRNPGARRRSARRDFDLDELRIVVVALQKEHRQCIRSVAESLEHHTRQIVLLTKANSSLADHVESMEKEMKALRAMATIP